MCRQDENRSEVTQPELPSEDSMFVHPSFMEQTAHSASLHTQVLKEHKHTELQIETKQGIFSVGIHISSAFSLEQN